MLERHESRRKYGSILLAIISEKAHHLSGVAIVVKQ